MPARASKLPLHTASALETAVGVVARSMMRTGTPYRRSVMASDKPVGPAPAIRIGCSLMVSPSCTMETILVLLVSMRKRNLTGDALDRG
jgi:hypothetical protein